jgi:uncharacterized protein (TIGR03435 family)
MARIARLSCGVVVTGMCGLAAARVAPAQAASAGADAGVSFAAYDVVLVKPVDSNAKMTMVGVQYTPDGIEATAWLPLLVRVAYGGIKELPTDDSVSGFPDWAKTTYFSVQAKMSPEQMAAFAKLGKDQQEAAREQMLQALLADRFKLKVHRETKQVPDYELVVAKGGPKLKESTEPDPNGPKGRDGKPIQGGFMMMRRSGQITAQLFSTEQLADFLQGSMGVSRMVKDKTGLTGKYNFTLNWTPDAAAGAGSVEGFKAAPGADDSNAPSIFTALQEQLGLKLQAGTGTIDAVVVDHVERPEGN